PTMEPGRNQSIASGLRLPVTEVTSRAPDSTKYNALSTPLRRMSMLPRGTLTCCAYENRVSQSPRCHCVTTRGSGPGFRLEPACTKGSPAEWTSAICSRPWLRGAPRYVPLRNAGGAAGERKRALNARNTQPHRLRQERPPESCHASTE